MGCLKLEYHYPKMQVLRTCESERSHEQKCVQWFTSPDPLAHKRPWESPYSYCGNNPINRVDPTGLIWYSLNDQGHIQVMRDADGNILGKGDNFDKLWSGSNHIRINDQSILSGLAETGKASNFAKSFVHGSPSELASVFLFASDNSNAEWRFSRYNAGSGDQYAIGTVHNSSLAISPSQMGFDRASEIAFIHSHPGEYNTIASEHFTMGWARMSDATADALGRPRGSPTDPAGDSRNVAALSGRYPSYSNSFVYFPHSGNIHHVRGWQQPALIRNIQNHNNNPNRLFWGVLNHR